MSTREAATLHGATVVPERDASNMRTIQVSSGGNVRPLRRVRRAARRPVRRGGIFSGMTSRPEPAFVVNDLGSKICDGFYVAVDRARDDLAEYRRDATRLSGRHSPTGLANWIQDQLVENLADELHGVPGVDFIDGPGHTREVLILGGSGSYYRFRVKRHHLDGGVSTYRTDGAIDFMTQESALTLFPYTEVKLTVGYLWDPALPVIGDAVISLRDDGGRRLLWMEPVPFSGAAGAVIPFPSPRPVPPALPSVDSPADGPSLPMIDLPDVNNDGSADGGEDRT